MIYHLASISLPPSKPELSLSLYSMQRVHAIIQRCPQHHTLFIHSGLFLHNKKASQTYGQSLPLLQIYATPSCHSTKQKLRPSTTNFNPSCRLPLTLRPLLHLSSKSLDLTLTPPRIRHISKILERAIASQLKTHLDCYQHYEPYQSGFRSQRGTENGFLSLDVHSLTIPILPDFSAAFNRINHSISILLSRLESSLSITGTAFSWFKSHLSDHGLHFHCYADDIQVHRLKYPWARNWTPNFPDVVPLGCECVNG